MLIQVTIVSDIGQVVLSKEHVDLLMAVSATGSVTGAAKKVGLSYKHAWDTLNAINTRFPSSLTSADIGGPDGGGTRLTKLGISVIEQYSRIAHAASASATEQISQFDSLLSTSNKDNQNDTVPTN